MPLGVVYKFFDDQGGYLAAVLTYYAFLSILPMLLIASAVLGSCSRASPRLQADILNSALAQFPIVGDELGRPGGIQGSTSAVVVGTLAAMYGVIGLGQAAQNAVNVAWGIPRNSRLNPIISRVRSVAWFVLAGRRAGPRRPDDRASAATPTDVQWRSRRRLRACGGGCTRP